VIALITQPASRRSRTDQLSGGNYLDIHRERQSPSTSSRRSTASKNAADAQNLDPEQRQKLRQQKTTPILNRFKRWLTKTAAREPPQSALAQACAYSLNHWDALTRFVDDGRLGPDNNLCERQIRSLAVGRRNYLFARSDVGAERAAVLYSLMRTCALHGVPSYEYLTDVLEKLAAGWPQARIAQLLPDAWADARRPSH
jgi:transposase